MKIDFVITYVNGSDPEWIRSRNEVAKKYLSSDASDCRYRDWNTLKYWFCTALNYCQWVNKIYLVLSDPSQVPDWFPKNNPRLKVVFHEEFIPQEYLPTFNSNTIEMFLGMIPGLSEHFVYFNDDFFIINPIGPEIFFTKNGLPRDTFCTGFNKAYPEGCYCHILLNNDQASHKMIEVLGTENPRILDEQKICKYFHFYPTHFAQAYLKSSWYNVHFLIKIQNCQPFRSVFDYNQWLFRNYQLIKNNYAETYQVMQWHKFYNLTDQNYREAIRNLINPDLATLVLNDTQGLNKCLEHAMKLTTEILKSKCSTFLDIIYE